MPGGNGILLDGSIVHYETLGRGRPVIFLHGWVGSWHYWFNSMQVVSGSYRAYALDLWGFGDSAHNVLNYSLEGQSTLLHRFLNEMGIGKIAILGHGLGALVGMTFAARFPQSVDRIMAVNCPLHYEALNRRMLTSTPIELADWLSDRSSEAITFLDDVPKTDPQAIPASIVGFQSNNIFAAFRNLNIPCLLVYGERDRAVIAPDESFPLSAMMHQILLERAGHFPMIEDAVVFERLLMNFLALDSGVSPKEVRMK
jgi:pimeloyl-ACP methyl ester carboxylesterase